MKSWLPVICMGSLLLPAFGGEGRGATAAQAAWRQQPWGRLLALSQPASHPPGFRALDPARCGILFTNQLAEFRHLTNQILLNGAGVALADVDGDGWTDIYLASADTPNRLFRNLGGWRFEDVTPQAGVGLPGLRPTGVCFADLDGDADADLLVNSFGQGTVLLFNDGHGRFRAANAVLNPGRGAMTTTLADVDGDGWLDIYICNYRTQALMDMPNARATFKRVGDRMVIDTINGLPLTSPALTNRFRLDAEGRLRENGEADVLYLNRAGRSFRFVPFTSGAFLDAAGHPLKQPPFDWGLTATFRDVNSDGRPDLYVCNDFETPDRLWLNQGGGLFRLAPPLAIRKFSLFSMAVDWADFNRDGRLDFFTLDMMSRDHSQRMRYLDDPNPTPAVPGIYADQPQFGRNTLQLNRGDDTWADIAPLAGLEAAEWAWSCAFVDVDLDGWPDLLAANGMERAARDKDVAEYLRRLRAMRRPTAAELFRARRAFPRLATANLAFRNRGDLTFEEISKRWGFDQQGVSQAMAWGDLDNDGDLDVVINNLNAPPLVLRNDTAAPRLALRLRGRPPNTAAIGARVQVTAPGLPQQSAEVIAGGRYLAGDDPILCFAAGAATNQLTVEISWPDGTFTRLEALPANTLCEVDQARAPSEPASPHRESSIPTPWFADRTSMLAHRHHEELFDDFTRQPLLPRRLSQPGPGLAWGDLDGDGWEDLVITSGRGGSPAVYTNTVQAGERTLRRAAWDQPAAQDQVAALILSQPQAPPGALLVAESHYESSAPAGAAVLSASPWPGPLKPWLPASTEAPGPLAMADLDGDGSLELFLGGRVLPGRYPQPASCRLFRRIAHAGQFTEDAENTATLKQAGLVTGAVFTDLTGDGLPELALACEWGPIRLFRNVAGRLHPWDPPVSGPGIAPPPGPRLSAWTGWWNSVAAGDFDRDGRMDLVAGNWGRNSRYQQLRHRPLRLYYGNLGGQGVVDLVEAWFEPRLGDYVPLRQLDILAASLPYLRSLFPTHRAFSTATLPQILAEAAEPPRVVETAWLAHTVFLNREDHFEARPLPTQAQFAPVFGIVSADFDGDGAEDLFLAQNFFASQPETPRDDAGRGLLLQGDGQGGWKPVPGQVSGLRIYGEQRAAAAADWNHDGRVDLAVGQNGAETRLFLNQKARPGRRLHLDAGVANPTGIGAWVRPFDAQGRPGPAREVRAAEGYASQNAFTLVLTAPGPVVRLQLRWPGGREQAVELPPGRSAVHLRQSLPGPDASPSAPR